MKRKKIAFFICSNGYGHLKRVLSVVRELLKLQPKIEITLFCSQTHVSLAKREINFVLDVPVKFDTTTSATEVSWLSANKMQLESFDAWISDLLKYKYLQEDTLIISDNHVTPLHIFENAILMGSFLWSDVNSFKGAEAEKAVQSEHRLLKKTNPYMLCVESMVMDAVLNNTQPVLLPWFCKKGLALPARRLDSIFITGGGTELLNNYLTEVCLQILKKRPSLIVYTDKKLYSSVSAMSQGFNSNIIPFDFSEQAFSELAAIVCRPGMGILTDCVRYNVPAIVINDEYNKEISHNANRVEQIGIGHAITASSLTIDEAASYILEFIVDKSRVESCVERLMEQPTGGAVLASQFILSKL